MSITGVAQLPARLDARDLMFLFNIDRPYDAALALKHAHPDSRVLLYPLHHPGAGIGKYLAKVSGPKGILGKIAGRRPDRYEAMVDAAKAFRTRDFGRLRVALQRKKTIANLMMRCELLTTSEVELEEIIAQFGHPSRGAWLLPHPVADHVALDGVALPRYILVAGRIEPRKNQLAALQTLAKMDLRNRGYEIVLAGGTGSDLPYFRETIDFALANGIIYVSQLPKNLFFPTVSGASLLINASFFEVTSLIDLYAINNAIPLITTIHGYYTSMPTLRQIDPSAWGHFPTQELCESINSMLKISYNIA